MTFLQPQPRRFYFAIPSINVYDWVIACGFPEAKQIAFETWGPVYNDLRWLTPENHGEVKLPTIR
jgi:hypothetical protein